MKKLFALLLALALVASLCFSVMAEGEDDADDEPKDPEAYFWIKDESTDADVSLTFFVPGSKLTDGVYKIKASVKFEGCEGTIAYVNCYIYDVNGALVAFKDFADAMAEDVVDGAWQEIEYEFNPCDGTYGDFAGKHLDASEIGKVTFGVGFYQATGKVCLQNLQFNKDLEVIWAKGFAAGLDIDEDADIDNKYGITADDEGIAWGVVRPEVEDNGNIAIGAEIDAPIGGGAYTASLNDGVAFGQQAYDNNWYGFNKNQNVETGVDYEGAALNRGTVIYDFGKSEEFVAVRAHMWDGAGSSGIATPTAIVAYSSADGENWDELGTLLLGEPGSIYWAELNLDAASGQFVKVEFYYEGTWLFCNEIEVIGAGIIDDPEEPSEEPSKEEPSEEPSKEQSKEESKPVTPKTGDNGMIALAVVSVIALAGAVIVKKSK